MVTIESVKGGLKELQKLLNDDDLWIKSPEGRDVLDEDKYLQAFPRSSKRNDILWTTESSRAVVFIQMNHVDIADMIADYPWNFLFPNMVASDKIIKVYSSGSDTSPNMTSHLVVKHLHAASPMLHTRKFVVHRICLQVDQGMTSWIVAEIPLDANTTPYSAFHRLPSGCLIQRISDHQSKVTWVEHTEVATSLPNQTSAFAFGAQRMAAWLQRYCEVTPLIDATHTLETQGIDAPHNQDKLTLMWLGEIMARGLFRNITPINKTYSTLSWSITGPADLMVHTSLYKPIPGSVVAAAVVAFPVKHSPVFVLQTLGDGRKHHQWDVLGGCKKLYMPRQYSTGADPRNSISAYLIEGTTDMLIKQVDANPSESLVLWSTVSKKYFDLISAGEGISEDSILISGFFISTVGHTTATNTCGSVITLVLRKLVEGSQPLQEGIRQQAIKSITSAINQTVDRVKEVLDKQRPPSRRAERQTDEQSESCKKPKLLK